jgi:hypothetical protein
VCSLALINGEPRGARSTAGISEPEPSIEPRLSRGVGTVACPLYLLRNTSAGHALGRDQRCPEAAVYL